MTRIEIEKIYNQLSKSLGKLPWFKAGKWQAKWHEFPKDHPEGLTFGVFKPHWFNSDRTGIHFETFIGFSGKYAKETQIALHLSHETIVPGTNIKRTSISKPFVDAIYPAVRKWPGYKFRTGKYGMQPFAKKVAVDESILSVLKEEFERLCVNLGDPMDDAICLASQGKR
ncbi:MAG: hypothetical protein NT027_16680 [Proteobacteria bacterium]|nr:hypothetical protein [Pseudomonadota bacterium]